MRKNRKMCMMAEAGCWARASSLFCSPQSIKSLGTFTFTNPASYMDSKIEKGDT